MDGASFEGRQGDLSGLYPDDVLPACLLQSPSQSRLIDVHFVRLFVLYAQVGHTVSLIGLEPADFACLITNPLFGLACLCFARCGALGGTIKFLATHARLLVHDAGFCIEPATCILILVPLAGLTFNALTIQIEQLRLALERLFLFVGDIAQLLLQRLKLPVTRIAHTCLFNESARPCPLTGAHPSPVCLKCGARVAQLLELVEVTLFALFIEVLLEHVHPPLCSRCVCIRAAIGAR